MKISIGADHAGFSLKEQLRRKLSAEGHEVVDFGTGSPDSCDYPDFARAVGRLHLEMEMGVCLLLGCAGWAIYARIPPWGRPLVLGLCLAPIVFQAMNYR